MSFTEIRKIIEKRKYNLTNVLQSGREEIDLSRQHRIYGAIMELDNILKTIDYEQSKEIRTNYDIALSNEQEDTILQRVTLQLKKSMKITRRKEQKQEIQE